jgi:methylmalonyl-CoA mutase
LRNDPLALTRGHGILSPMGNPPDNDLPLAADFPPVAREQWRQMVDAALKGSAFDQALVSQTYDRLRIEPLAARKADARPVAGRIPGAAWAVMQRVDHPDPALANAQALQDLESGANGLSLVFAGSPGAYGFGLPAARQPVERVFDGVHLDAGIAIDAEFGPQSEDAPLHVAAAVKSRGLSPAAVNIRFGFDPLGAMAVSGSGESWSERASIFAASISRLAADGFKGPFAAADGRIVHSAGGSEAQELAFAIAVAVAYLRALEEGGIALDTARKMIFFRLAADAEQFLTIAKFRALRKLWARVEQACGLPPAPAFIGAETAWRMMTRRDPHVNIVRATIAVLSAGLGGADAITVLPFTQGLGLPDGFARRIARNTQLILLEESHLARLADPAAGAGGIEDLTDKLCRAAWALFQEIEAAGGAGAALEQGLIQDKVLITRAERAAAIASGREVLVGATVFPNPDELPVAVLDVAPDAARSEGRITPLTPMRLAEPSE